MDLSHEHKSVKVCILSRNQKLLLILRLQSRFQYMHLTEHKGYSLYNTIKTKPNTFKGTSNCELKKLNVKQTMENMHRGMHIR